MPSSVLWAVDLFGRVHTLSTTGQYWEPCRDAQLEFKRVSATTACCWGIACDNQVYVFVCASEVPIRRREEAYENQRWNPMSGFCEKLLPSDRWPWSDVSGLQPRPLDGVALPSPHWEWESDWYVDENFGGEPTEKGGWTYAIDFPATYTRDKKWNSCVRRRKWIRYRRYKSRDAWAKIPSKDDPKQLPDPFNDLSVGGWEITEEPVGRLSVWAVSLQGKVWYREDVSHANPEGSLWSLVDCPGEVAQISCGPHDLLWAVLWEGPALVREGINRNNPQGSAWSIVEPPGPDSGILHVSVGVSVVWAVTKDQKVWFRRGVNTGCDFFTAKMTSLSTSAQCSASESACGISTERINQVRPKLPLLKILQAAGAQGEMFTVKEVMHYLGQYIMVKQLYDQQEQHMVYCGGDLLGELLGRQSFSVKDPSPLYDMLRKNLVSLATATTDAAQTLALAQDHSMDIPSQDQLKQCAEGSSSSRKRAEENNVPTLPTSQHKRRNSREDEDLIENLTQEETSRLDLGFEEWDVAGLPWWFLGNLRNNYTPRSNGSTDLQTNQDIGTAVVSDTTDDLWFLNESVSEQLGVGIKGEAALTDQASEEVGKVGDKKMIEERKSDDPEDSKSLSDDTDVEVTSEDEWQCTECRKFNSPSKRYCFRCWALRKDWYSDCSKLTHSLSTSDITAIPEKKENEGIDVPDCRRTISAPVVRPKDVYRKEENSKLFDPCSSVEFLDLAHSSESQETISSMGEQADHLFEQRTDTENMEDCQNILKPCSLCEKRPRDGNIIHGRTSHLTTCFHCARRLKKTGASCPICKKEIQLVIKVFIA